MVGGGLRIKLRYARLAKGSVSSGSCCWRTRALRTDICVYEDDHCVDVVTPLDAEAALLRLPFLKDVLNVASLQPEGRVSNTASCAEMSTYSGEKFARCRMRVTAAEIGGCEEEGAARRVPLGREMDMVLRDRSVCGGGRGRARTEVVSV